MGGGPLFELKAVDGMVSVSGAIESEQITPTSVRCTAKRACAKSHKCGTRWLKQISGYFHMSSLVLACECVNDLLHLCRIKSCRSQKARSVSRQTERRRIDLHW